MDAPEPRVTVVIPCWNNRRWLPGCLGGLAAQRYQDFRVILVDNGSSDDSVSFVRQNYPQVRLITFARNLGFAPAVNAGVRQARSEYVALLNTDTVPRPDWLLNLVETMDASPPDVGCLASKMLKLQDPNLIDDAGDRLSWYGSAQKRGLGQPAGAYDRLEEVFSACAGAALYRRGFLEAVGGFDESFVSYLEDVDVGLRGRLLGYRCLFVPGAEILHQSHGSGLARSRYVYLVTRNRLTLIGKNIPLGLLLKHAWRLLYGQLYFFLAHKRPLDSLAGTLAFLWALPRVLRQRRRIQRRKRISNRTLDAMLSRDLGEMPLRQLVGRKLRGARAWLGCKRSPSVRKKDWMEEKRDVPWVRYSAAGGVVIHDGRVLLLDRPEREELRLPKGHVESGETAQETALREVREETGYADLIVLAELGSQQVEFVDPYEQRRVSRHDTYFLLGLASQAQVEREEQDQKFVPTWLPLERAVQRLSFDAEREFLRRALDLVRQ